MFWTTKYCPKTLNDVADSNTHYFHKEISKKLLIYFDKSNKQNTLFEHPIIYLNGPVSSGKWTFAHLILQHLFGDTIYMTRKKRIQINQHDPEEIVVSQHHCEFYESTFLYYKANIFQKIIETLGESKNICNQATPFYILCKNIHEWTYEFQRIIKEASERYPETLRFIITGHVLIPCLSTLSTIIRIPSPKMDMMLQCLQYICENESIEYTKTIEQKIKQKIQNSADSSYYVILLWLQEKMISGSWRNIKKVNKIELKHVVNLLFSSNSLNTLIQLRDMLIECIAYRKIEKLPRYLTEKICKHPSLCSDCITDCISIIAKFDSRIKLHHRNHIHYEAMLYQIFHCIHHKRYMGVLETHF